MSSREQRDESIKALEWAIGVLNSCESENNYPQRVLRDEWEILTSLNRREDDREQ